MPSVACSKCDRPVLARGWCSSHYTQWFRAQRRAAGHPARTEARRECEHCGAQFVTRKERMTRYCSLSCAQRATAAQTTATRRANLMAARALRSQVVIYTGPPRSAPDLVHGQGKTTWRAGQCRVCATWFVHWNHDATCSAICQRIDRRNQKRIARERRRARKRNAYVSDVYRLKVFESDSYRCHLCRRRTDPAKAVPHPKAPTIDHLVPLSAGGTHEPSNCRTACFRCNSRKGNRGGGDQFALPF